jgi:sugar transferase EpsL
VLFQQVRPGLRDRPFTIYKFRTMMDERDTDGNLLSDGERLTRLGRFLRKTSMDPQITQIFAD